MICPAIDTTNNLPKGFEMAGTYKSFESNKKRISNAGFTLVEIMVVVVILSALFIILLPSVRHFIEVAKISRCSSEIRSLERQIILYSLENNDNLPNSLNDIGRGDLLDPWGNFYQYHVGSWRQDQFLNFLNVSFDLYSKGRDGDSQQKLSEQSSRDDIVRAGDGGWVGSVEKYFLN